MKIVIWLYCDFDLYVFKVVLMFILQINAVVKSYVQICQVALCSCISHWKLATILEILNWSLVLLNIIMKFVIRRIIFFYSRGGITVSFLGSIGRFLLMIFWSLLGNKQKWILNQILVNITILFRLFFLNVNYVFKKNVFFVSFFFFKKGNLKLRSKCNFY